MTDFLTQTDWTHQAQVFVAPLLTELDPYQAILSKDEWQRLTEMKLKSRQQEFTSGRVLLRQSLAKLLQCPPAEIVLSINDQGKPFCSHPQAPHFSISHCAQHVAVALSLQPVGIDIEQAKARRNFNKIAEHYYAISEQKTLKLLQEPQEQENYFYQLWVLKEAIAKATGKGLAASLNHIELRRVDSQLQRINSNDEPMQLFNTKVDKHLHLGLATLGKDEITYQVNVVKITSAIFS